MKIFLLEDDSALFENVCEFLEENGFEVKGAANYQNALEILYENHFDLLLLDVNIPGGEGFSLLKKIRANHDKTPAIFITSYGSLEDLQKGFESGCDDYLRKPFALQELLIRIKSLIKRTYQNSMENIGDGIEFCPDQNCVVKNDKTYELSKKETELLKLFAANQNSILSHEFLFEKIWGWDEEPSELSLRAYIKNIRKILGHEAIKTIRGSGYVFGAS